MIIEGHDARQSLRSAYVNRLQFGVAYKEYAFSGQARITPCLLFLARWHARRYRPRAVLASTLAAAVW